MWSDGEPIDPSPTIDQAVNGGFPWLEIRCARCKTPSDVDLAAMKHPPTTFVHDLASRLRCRKRQHRSLVQAAVLSTRPHNAKAVSWRSQPIAGTISASTGGTRYCLCMAMALRETPTLGLS